MAAGVWHQEKALFLFFPAQTPCPSLPIEIQEEEDQEEDQEERGAGKSSPLWCWSKMAHPFWTCRYLMGYLEIPLLCASARNSCTLGNDASPADSSLPSSCFFSWFRPCRISAGLLLLQVDLYLDVKWIQDNSFFPRTSSVLEFQGNSKLALLVTKCPTARPHISLTSRFPGQADIYPFCPPAAENIFQPLKTIPLKCLSLVSLSWDS